MSYRCYHWTRAQRRWYAPPMSITELRLGSSLTNSLFFLQMKSLSSTSRQLRKQTLPSCPTTPTLDSVAKILPLTCEGKGVGWNFTFMPEQKMRSVSVRKISELEEASKSTIFSPLQSSSWVLAKEDSSRSLSTRGLVLAPKTPPLFIPRQQMRPLSSSSMMNRSMAATFLILACLFDTNSPTSSTGAGVAETLAHSGSCSKPLPQAQRCPWSQTATEKSLAAATLTTECPPKDSCGIRTGDPVLAPGTPTALECPQAYTAPSAVRASECREPRLRTLMWMLGASKETLRGSSVSAEVDCPSLPSWLRPTVYTEWSLVTKPRWYSPVDTLMISSKFCTWPGVQYWLLVGLPHPQVVSPQVSRCPLVEKDRLIIRDSINNISSTTTHTHHLTRPH